MCDHHEATGTITRLRKAGLKVIPLAQAAAVMNAGTKELMQMTVRFDRLL